ncbi:class I adenylate-forming enzyme family protein [Hoeflea sp.]|uniref:class I adenylate-forming enzyme family protein n=1 Tax=Hoeflea sp. TaxID=1940281 RepID=UPI00198A8AC6|nr:class I adenylate-forming enzyme family protein [Hoeflea sp.]MBC7282728.1 acyl--CoA ligase [Hoeflea sp.]
MNRPDDILEMTVPALLAWQARKRPMSIALSAQSALGDRQRYGYAQLVKHMEAVAAGLLARGVCPGDRIAVFLDNDSGLEAILTALAQFRLGGVVAPLNTRYSDSELSHALELVDPVAIVARASDAARLRSFHARAQMLIVNGEGEGDPSASAWPRAADHLVYQLPPMPTDPDTPASLLFTSGTTARAKAVMHSHGTTVASGVCTSEAIGLRPGDLYQGGWPFFTSSGLNLGCASAWASGAGLVFENMLDNAGRLNLIASEQSTFYHGVPSVVYFMIEDYARGSFDVSSLRRIGYGGSAMPLEVVKKIDVRWPHVEQVQIYGMTESGPNGTILEPARVFDKFGSVGRAMPHCKVDIIGEDGQRLPQGERGEILLSGPAVAKGYFRNPEATKAGFAFGGIRTGDVGYLDPDGYLFFTDRLKDIINRGGLKIASIAVEEVLYRHPLVREAAVVAVPHKALGEDVGACIVPVDGQEIDIESLKAFCAENLADYECPRHWRVLDALPKNPMGKVLKANLREMFNDPAKT